MTPWFLGELNDELEIDFWSNPPEFIAMAHPALVRQRMRHLGMRRRPLGQRDGKRLAIDMDADLVVVSEIERFSWFEDDVSERAREAETDDGEKVTYYEIRGKLKYHALVRWMIVDRSGHVIEENHFEESRRRDFRRAEYEGNWHDLDLSGSERKLFRPHQYADLREKLDEEMATRIASRLAERTFRRLSREVR